MRTSRTTRSRPPRASRWNRRRTSTTTRSEQARPYALALGSNRGESVALLVGAVELLEQELGPLVVASLYRSEPVSPIPQPDYLNSAALGHGRESPEALLALAARIERHLGRRRGPRGGPREIDLDLLIVGSEIRSGEDLELPHPRLRQRRFVLAPLAEIAPDLPLPPDGETPARLLERLPDRPWVERLGPFPARGPGAP